MSWQVGAADESFCFPLHPVQQVKVAAGTGHQGERRVLHDLPDLSLVQGQQAVGSEEVIQASQQSHLLGGFSRHVLELTVKT